MKVVSIILACIFALIVCDWFIGKPAAQEVKIESLPDPELAPLPDRGGYSTLPGWSAGYRLYLDLTNFNYYDDDKGKVRLFGKYKSPKGNVIKFGIDGSSDSGVFFLEQEFKF